MNPYEDESIDFIEVEGTRKRTLTPLDVSPRKKTESDFYNTVLDMRIVNNKIVTTEDSVAHVHLIFKLDYYPKVFIDTYTLFLTFRVDVFDRNRVLERNPTSDLAVALIANYYKECGERLFRELNTQSKNKFFTSLKGHFIIDLGEAQEQTKIILNNYFG